jgi:hypothetical protein
VENIPRCVFVLPREWLFDAEGHSTDVRVGVSDHVMKEFGKIAETKGIAKCAACMALFISILFKLYFAFM